MASPLKEAVTIKIKFPWFRSSRGKKTEHDLTRPKKDISADDEIENHTKRSRNDSEFREIPEMRCHYDFCVSRETPESILTKKESCFWVAFRLRRIVEP